MANLINGNDPRKKILKNVVTKSNCEKINYAFKCLTRDDLDSKELFAWAVKKFPEFKPNIPIPTVNKLHRATEQDQALSIVAICGGPEKIQQKYGDALFKIKELEEEIKGLKTEIRSLSNELLKFKKKRHFKVKKLQ